MRTVLPCNIYKVYIHSKYYYPISIKYNNVFSKIYVITTYTMLFVATYKIQVSNNYYYLDY